MPKGWLWLLGAALLQPLAHGNEVLISLTNQIWRYDQSGAFHDTFAQRSFDDSTWPEGRSILAYENSTNTAAVAQNILAHTNTVLLSPPVAPGAPNHTSDYFRTRFNFGGPGDPDTWVLTLSNLVDDAYVAYLNGVEVDRFNMHPLNDMLAAASGPQGEGIYFVRQMCIPPGTLVIGENVLAVRVHQNAGTSTDVVWGTVLHAHPGSAPAVRWPASDVTIMLLQGANTNLMVTVDAAPCATYQWYKGNQPIAGATSRSFTIANMDASQAGAYFLRSVNGVGSTDSPSFRVTYVEDVTPPTVVSASADVRDLSIVRVAFSEDLMDVLNPPFDPVTFYVEDRDNPANFIGAGAVSYGSSSNIAIVTLAEPRDPAIRYQLTISGHSIEDLFGHRLADPTVVAVTVPTVFQNGSFGYGGTHDTELRQSAPGDSFETNTSIQVGLNPVTHGLLRFDQIIGYGGGQIPPYVTIVHSARLRMHTVNPGAVRMLRMLAPWNEAQSTWNSMGNGIDQTNGVEAGKTEGLIVANTVNAFVDIDVTAAVQAWAVGASNYGWALLPSRTNGWGWASSEHATVVWRPELMVEHSEFDYPACLIVKQPEPVTVRAGDPIFLEVAAIGRSLQFQWFRNGTAIPGATSSAYSVPSASITDDGAYYVTIHKPAPLEYTCSSAGVQVTVVGSLRIWRNDDGSLTVSWGQSSAALQEAAHLDGPWTDVPGAVSPMQIEIENGDRFYRLRSS